MIPIQMHRPYPTDALASQVYIRLSKRSVLLLSGSGYSDDKSNRYRKDRKMSQMTSALYANTHTRTHSLF